jgi:hypothetical protein
MEERAERGGGARGEAMGSPTICLARRPAASGLQGPGEQQEEEPEQQQEQPPRMHAYGMSVVWNEWWRW